jgi:hypothetical protein
VKTGRLRRSSRLSSALCVIRCADKQPWVSLAKRAPSLAALVTAALLLALSLLASSAAAVILPATTGDGPSEDIVGFGGAAMSEDGTGGVVYLKRVEGVVHLFVARYAGGHWLAPMRVDAGQQFAASWPRIGAGPGGELIVVWATPFAEREQRPVYELLGAVLGAGASSFQPATVVDPDIEEATGTSPALSVSASGQADVVYRVVETANPSVPLLRPGDVVEQVRLAHFNGQRWASLGAVNRDPGASMRPPTEANGPQIAVGPTGKGLVVWQEPEVQEGGVARIWARRIFGTSLDYVMPVAATSYHGAPITQDADAPAVSFSRLGQAEVAYRQTAGPGSVLPGPRIFLNILPDGESANGAEFQGASVADEAVAGGESASVGPPSIDISEQRSLRLVYDSNGVPRVIEGNDKGLAGTLSLGPGFAGAEPFAVSVMNPEGGGVSAWPSADPQGNPDVAVREDFPDDSVQTALVGGGAGGEVAELSVGRSGLGDAIVAFRQGPFGHGAIVAATVTAPPQQVTFLLTAPKGWIRPAQALITWLPAASAAGPLTYQLVLDGHAQATPAGVFSARLNPRGLASGHHTVQVLATDANGQSTLTAPAELLVDGVPPRVAIGRGRGGSVSVRVKDRFSGVNAHAVTVSWGDGTRGGGRALLSHRYVRPGVYLVTVHVLDKIGIGGTVRKWVTVA